MTRSGAAGGGGRPPRVAIVFAQFAAYHVDRCRAAALRLGPRADVLAIEVATTSTTYAWEPSGAVEGAEKCVLFPGLSFEAIPARRRFAAAFAVLRHCDAVFFGIGYNEPDVIALAFALRLFGVRVFMMTESKFDDVPRRLGREAGKALLLSAYRGAFVGGARQQDYLRFLGFRRRPVLTGYDAVDLDRVRAAAGCPPAPAGVPFAERGFVFVGRFVAKKNLAMLVEAYAVYAAEAGAQARRLTLVGGGELEPRLRTRIAELGLADRVAITGFVSADEVARHLAGALALLLPSTEEQWGLVVNEALAFHLPAIVSEAVGARDALVRNQLNGFVVESHSPAGWAAAMAALAADEPSWRAMVAASAGLAARGHVDRFAEAIEALALPPHGR
ncbi:MAG: glycosyltransferase [Novosphingobium sp.]